MWPTIGSLRAYTLLYLAAFLAHYLASWWIARRHGLGWRVWITVSVLFSVCSIVGAKILYDLHQSEFNWQALFTPRHYAQGGYWGGLMAYFVLAAPAALLLSRNRRAALDLVALAVPVPFFIAKLGCLLNGCCYGRPCSLPWAVVYPEGSRGAPCGVPLHPTQIYEMLVMAMVLFAFWCLDRDRWRGTMLLWFVAIFGIGRAVSEAFRGDFQRHIYFGPFTLTQLICLGSAGAAVALLAYWKHPSVNQSEGARAAGKAPIGPPIGPLGAK